jgi:hypothetical protein
MKASNTLYDMYIDLCSRNERSGLAWMKRGVWKLRGIRRGWKKQHAPYAGTTKMIRIHCWAAQKKKKKENAIYK